MIHDLALAFVGAGVAVLVLAATGALAIGADELKRLHFLTPTTSVAGPLICVGLCLDDGWGITSGETVLIVGLLFVSGPVLSAATGRLIAQNRGKVGSEPPE